MDGKPRFLLGRMRPCPPLLLSCLLHCLLLQWATAFYLPGTYPNLYAPGDALWVKVNSLTSVETELPFGYYTLPFCRPFDGIKHSSESLGELLMGDRVENSPYRFRMNANEKDLFLCSSGPLSAAKAEIIKRRIDEFYQVNFILDNLPAVRYTRKDGSTLRWTGYPVGFHFDDTHYLFNHLKFKVLVHGYTIVGFEVSPCSYQHSADEAEKLKMYDKFPSSISCGPSTPAMKVKEGESIVFSYEVSFVESQVRWTSRWDAYLMREESRVHWFSILNSLMVVTLLAGIVLMILFRTVRRDLASLQDDELGREDQRMLQDEIAGWKLVSGDVFRAPENPEFLCILVGDGVQILAMGVVTILLAAIGFMSPASRGALITGMLFSYIALGFAGGYVSAKLWKTINKGRCRGWVLLSLKVAFFYTGIALTVFILLNFLLWGSQSSGALPLSTFGTLLLLWSCVSAPLTILGSYYGVKSEPIEHPTKTNQVPREIPKAKYPSRLLILGSGMFPFATLFIELFFIMSSLWLGQAYYVFSFLSIVLLLLVLVCAEVSLVITYMHLCGEDWRWWWKSFFASGSVAVYIFFYSVAYYMFDLHSLSGPVSTSLYLGYSLLMALAVSLATGAVGFLSSFWFVHFLFSSVKLD